MKQNILTRAVDVVILDPPAPPTNSRTSPFTSSMIDGHIDDIGRFSGSM